MKSTTFLYLKKCKHQSYALLALCEGIHRWPVDSLHKGSILWKVFPCYTVIIWLPLQWRHNERDGVSNHQPHHCFLNRLFQAQMKENIKSPRWRLKSPASPLFPQPFIQAQMKENIKSPRHWPLWGEFTGHRWNPPHKGPVTRKIFPFDDVIMDTRNGCGVIVLTSYPVCSHLGASGPFVCLILWQFFLSFSFRIGMPQRRHKTT